MKKEWTQWIIMTDLPFEEAGTEELALVDAINASLRDQRRSKKEDGKELVLKEEN